MTYVINNHDVIKTAQKQQKTAKNVKIKWHNTNSVLYTPRQFITVPEEIFLEAIYL